MRAINFTLNLLAVLSGIAMIGAIPIEDSALDGPRNIARRQPDYCLLGPNHFQTPGICSFCYQNPANQACKNLCDRLQGALQHGYTAPAFCSTNEDSTSHSPDEDKTPDSPDEGDSPYPDEGDSPHPDEGDSPHPDEGDSPHPDEGDSPHPDEGDSPHPDEGDSPHPDEGDSPHPDEGDSPYPDEGNSPTEDSTSD